MLLSGTVPVFALHACPCDHVIAHRTGSNQFEGPGGTCFPGLFFARVAASIARRLLVDGLSRRRCVMQWLKVLAAGMVVAGATAHDAGAQAPASPGPTAVTAGWQDGFILQSANGENRLVLGLTAQLDGRFSLDDPAPIVNTFAIRKARPTFSGRVAKYFDFKVMPDFGNDASVLQDAYFDIRFSPKFRLRNGKDKTPVGYELLQGDAYLLFPERALASSLLPNRDVGIQALGELSSRLSYAGGVFNGV